MEDTLQQAWAIFVHIIGNITNPEAWQDILGRPGVFWSMFLVVNLIVFTETGLLFGFFLPGDSLLVTLGIVANAVKDGNSEAWPLVYLLPALCFAAIVGDSLGYWIGRRAGVKLFQREDSFFFRKNHLLAAQAYYDRHGGKTIIIARFMPFIRTFAPVVAGIGRMEYKRFLAFNIAGGIAWILSMFFLGYWMHVILEPMLRPIFGEQFKIAKQIDKIVFVIVFLSVAPMLVKGMMQWRKSRDTATESVTKSTSTSV